MALGQSALGVLPYILRKIEMELFGRRFREPGDPPEDLDVETILVGIDLTDSMKVFMARALGRELTDEGMEKAIREGLEGRP
jgi:hypothetical protein